MGTGTLGPEDRGILGLSEETTCYVSTRYFEASGRFADYVVHEAAHVFHNCKRQTVGLPETRRREWLLDIDFRKRETFAYACEAYSRIVALEERRAHRRELLREHENALGLDREEVNHDAYVALLRDAVESRNGWKRILVACAPVRR